MVRVTRTSGSVWTLYTSALPTASGTGAVASAQPSAANTPVNQGTATNSTYTNFASGYFGFAAVHSTGSGARTGAEFDQLYFDTSSSSPLTKELAATTLPPPGMPSAFQLYQNYPNPFNPATRIRFEVPNESRVDLIVYDVLGREVTRLLSDVQDQGIHEVLFDAANLASGVYYYRLTATSLKSGDTYVETKKLLIAK